MIDFDLRLYNRLGTNLSSHPVRKHSGVGLRRAAVAVVVVDSDPVLHGEDNFVVDDNILSLFPGGSEQWGNVAGTAGGASVLLTRRSTKLRAHAGQWALPGGRVGLYETALDAALRELREELGLRLEPSDLLGRLDDYATRSGYVITPFVFWGGSDPSINPNPDEVARVYRIGLHELCRHDSPRFISIPESERPVIQLPIGTDLIHAPTAAVLYQFRAVAYEGRTERVDHLEQPVFAWR
ncbi:MAG: CoA pyrophosphatase [Deltaproteobacteria bacterium]|nr:CoA pyrophosphatase [Deltaproteobacteria bacterium]